jgi:hypothetical protein
MTQGRRPNRQIVVCNQRKPMLSGVASSITVEERTECSKAARTLERYSPLTLRGLRSSFSEVSRREPSGSRQRG